MHTNLKKNNECPIGYCNNQHKPTTTNNNNKKPTLFLAIFDGDGVCECKDKCISNA
tara:strand:- start:86 stop:253 length:168 start_codon:yes stop_codon:yes gene_type:complete